MVDWIALVVSLVAILLGLVESRRNHSVWLKLLSCRSSFKQDIQENGAIPFGQLLIRIRNIGVSLHGLTASIQFIDDENLCTVTISLPREKLAGDMDELAKGMIAEFAIKTYQLGPPEKSVFKRLKDPRKQDAVIRFYSQNYLCATFKIRKPTSGPRYWWNLLVAHLNVKLMRTYIHQPSGRQVVWNPNFLPIFRNQLSDVMRFVDDLNREDGSVNNVKD